MRLPSCPAAVITGGKSFSRTECWIVIGSMLGIGLCLLGYGVHRVARTKARVYNADLRTLTVFWEVRSEVDRARRR